MKKTRRLSTLLPSPAPRGSRRALKKWGAGICFALLALPLTAQTAEHMDNLTAEQKAAATDVRLTGKLTTTGNSDFRQLRDLCHQLRAARLAEADCERIPNNAFHSRRQLKVVELPHNVKAIGTQAFYACRSLREVTLPQSLEQVGDAAFSSCDSLERLTIEGAPQIGEFAFARLKNLREVRVASPVPPAAKSSTFEGIDRKRVKLTVPEGSENLYRRAEGWSRFFAEPTPQALTCNPQEVLIPQPAVLEVKEGATLHFNRPWECLADDGLFNEVKHAGRILHDRLPAADPSTEDAARLTLALDSTLTDPEAYTLDITENSITIKGRTAAGVFYGLMTLDQLLRADGSEGGATELPQLHIADQPRTHVRELMVDPCRIFVPFGELKAFIPEMARYKLNSMHLHLVDDQAWRIEIKAYPKLVAESSSRVGMDDMLRPISGYYTQEQMRELVDWAAQYHVQIVPEIEMPGHEVAAIHAYPELTCHAKQVPIRTTCGVSNELLCPANEFTYTFLGNVFRELAAIFPSPYVHLGGDEAGMPALDCWTSCPKCQELKRKLGITTTDRSENWRLQEYLFNRVIDTLRTKYGKTPMFWYETDFKKIQPGCVAFAWRVGLTQAALDAAVSNHARIMLCPGEHCYLDYPMAQGDCPEVNWGMPLTPLRQTYALDPGFGRGEAFERDNLFGVAGTLWSECINSPERIYYQAYPRALALAEAAWSPQRVRSWEGFVKRLAPTVKDMMRRGLTYSMEY